jgi:hypothetical protein
MDVCLLRSFVAACFLITSPVLAQPIDSDTKLAARELGEQGIGLYKDGKYDDALERFDRAAKLVDVPSLNLYAARCLEKLGRWVEASERYLRVTRMPVVAGELEDQALARTRAGEERAALLPRIPKLEIAIEGADPASVTVELDGKAVPAALLGVSRRVDPGEHRIVATLGEQKVERDVKLGEGARERVSIELQPEPGAKPPPAMAPEPRSTAPAPEADSGTSSGATQRTLGWIGIGVGSAGLVFGGITGFIAMGSKSDLDDTCLDRKCGPDQHSDVDSYNRQRLLSSVGFGIGLVGMAAGITLLATAPAERPAVSARVHAGGVSLEGSF